MIANLPLAATTIDGFDLFAFLVIAVLCATTVILIVWLGSLPGKIAASRNHPYAKAVNAASWISFLTLGALWPLAFVWAFFPPRPGQSPRDGGEPS